MKYNFPDEWNIQLICTIQLVHCRTTYEYEYMIILKYCISTIIRDNLVLFYMDVQMYNQSQPKL